MNKIDPKELGIPNICFSLVNPDNTNVELYKQQRLERGFDDSETWSLTDTISNFIIPRLQRYIEVAQVEQTPNVKENLALVLRSFQLIARNEGSRDWTDDEAKIVQQGLAIFPQIFLSLWW